MFLKKYFFNKYSFRHMKKLIFKLSKRQVFLKFNQCAGVSCLFYANLFLN